MLDKSSFPLLPYCLRIMPLIYILLALPAAHSDNEFGSTILPTDVIRPPGPRGPVNKYELTLLRKLPPWLYVDVSAENSFRLETNPFQSPTKRVVMRQQLPLGTQLYQLTPQERVRIGHEISEASRCDQVFRSYPSVTVGYSPNDNIQLYCNYFAIRDSLFKGASLNSTTQSIGVGSQYTRSLGKGFSLQPQILIRELYQTDEIPVLDYLPQIVLQHSNKSGSVTSYISSQLQIRFRHFIADSQRELDPFYTAGVSYKKGRWTFSASTTFNQNFRKPFLRNSQIPVNNYAIISDFEVDRQVFKDVPGLQAFLRAEPVWNFCSHNTPGLAGMDFRLYYGLSLAASKPAIAGKMKQMRKHYEQQN